MDEPGTFAFGPFRFDQNDRLLFRGEEPVPLPPKAALTLLVLLRNAPRLVEKDDLLKEVWPDTFVEEGNLAHNISLLRKVLGGDRNGNGQIETVPRRGYRFIAPVERQAGPKVANQDEAPEPTAGPVLVAEAPATTSRGAGARRSGRVMLAVVTLGVVVVIALVGTKILATSRGHIRTIAVLPFQVMPANSMPQHFGIGLSDGIISDLSDSGQIKVRPTSAVLPYISASANSAEVGRQLKVDGVLEGSVARVGDQVRVTAQLVSATDGTLLWAETLVEPYTSVFDVEQWLSERISRRLKLQLTPEERRRMLSRHTSNLEAYELYSKGRYFYYRDTPDDLRKSLESLRAAVQKDPDYARAWAAVAQGYVWLANHTALPPEAAYPEARAAANRALALDDRQADAHKALALILANHDWDWVGAERHFRRAIELDRNDALSYMGYYQLLDHLGRFDEAIAANQAAQALDPGLAGRIHLELSMIYLDAQRADASIEECRTALQLAPRLFFCHTLMGIAYTSKQMYPEAIAEHRRAMQMNPDDPDVQAIAAFTYAMSGQRDQAEQILRQLEERSKRDYVRHISFAYIHAALGNNDQSFAFLDKAYREHDDYLAALKVSPVFRPLARDSRFALALARMHLPR